MVTQNENENEIHFGNFLLKNENEVRFRYKADPYDCLQNENQNEFVFVFAI